MKLPLYSFGPGLVAAILMAPAASNAADPVELVRTKADAGLLALRNSVPADIPQVRGYRAVGDGEAEWPHVLQTEGAPPQLLEAMRTVAGRLALDGLVPVTARVIQIIGPDAFLADETAAFGILKQVGLPVDLLAAFELEGGEAGGLIRTLATKLAGGAKVEELEGYFSGVVFRYMPSAAGFRLASEAGQSAVEMVRMQTPTAEYWKGLGDGSSLDVVRGLCAALPESRFIVCTQDAIADALKTEAGKWSTGRKVGITVLSGPWTPAQWAQDNGKPGSIPKGDGRELATLVPRYASRGEERSACDPAETYVVEGINQVGHRIIRSHLLFQGGDLIPVFDPASGKRVLLIGEAEIYRNTALGLSRQQVEEAFRVECGVDRVVVLPAVSFHIDVELTAREVRGKIVVLVNDEIAAARLIVERSIGALGKLGRLDDAGVGAALKDLAAGDVGAMAQRIAGPVMGLRDANGIYSDDVVAAFTAGAVDSGVANIARFLLAMDILTGRQIKADELPADPFALAYILSLQRRAADREQMHATLRGLGWHVVGVPSLSDETRGINYVNGIQAPGRYLMPAYGGFFEPVDGAAAAAIRTALGPGVEIVSIPCGETQRRLGAIHCAASVCYGE